MHLHLSDDDDEKSAKRLAKLRHCVELEISERKQIDDILDFFITDSHSNPLLGTDAQFIEYLSQPLNRKNSLVLKEMSCAGD